MRQLFVEFFRPGQSTLSGRALWRAGRVVISIVISMTNLIGAGTVLMLSYFVVPLPVVGNTAHVNRVNAVAAVAYVIVAVPLGALIGARRLFGLRRWLLEDRPATAQEQRTVLHAPLRLSLMQLAWWAGAAVLFGFLNGRYSGTLGLRVAVMIAITGMVTAALAYFLTERIMRGTAARALESGIPGRVIAPGVTSRALLAWMVGTGLPVLGVVAVGVLVLAGDTAPRDQLGIAMVVLGGVGIVVGLLAVALAARATAAPVNSVRRALREVQKGEFDAHVPVYDATQIGQLQLGFNQMVDGLAERERIREAFGTYVDPDVAEHILEEGTKLEGEEVEVTLLFLDVRDFTSFAENTPAPEVVAAINRLFETVVPIIHEHGGRIDKFIGDGLLAVFGAPRRREDHADEALAVALEIAEAVKSDEAGELEIGVGLNSGTVVAGNVGGAGRLEFSVIGDPVNVAARVEAATRQTGDEILIAERTKELLKHSDVHLVEREGATLKGKTEAVRLFAPSD
ncbi:MAG TPA: adenylate/guanylate cyclase domain-containing protein [Thermoleophilaceae bacterium]